MRLQFAKKFGKENGFTMVELLAVLVLMGIVLGLISTTIIYGVKSFRAVSVENILREEADIVMSAVITELYAFSPDRIYVYTDEKTGASGIKLKRAQALKGQPLEETIAIRGGQLQIQPTILAKEDNDSTGTPVDVAAAAAKSGAYQATRVNASLISGSSIFVECSNYAQNCDTGLINIKLVLQQQGADRNSAVTLESRFGF